MPGTAAAADHAGMYSDFDPVDSRGRIDPGRLSDLAAQAAAAQAQLVGGEGHFFSSPAGSVQVPADQGITTSYDDGTGAVAPTFTLEFDKANFALSSPAAGVQVVHLLPPPPPPPPVSALLSSIVPVFQGTPQPVFSPGAYQNVAWDTSIGSLVTTVPGFGEINLGTASGQFQGCVTLYLPAGSSGTNFNARVLLAGGDFFDTSTFLVQTGGTTVATVGSTGGGVQIVLPFAFHLPPVAIPGQTRTLFVTLGTASAEPAPNTLGIGMRQTVTGNFTPINSFLWITQVSS